MNDRLIQKLIFIFYVILVISISLLPSSILNIGSLWKYDKFIHFVEYLILGFLFLNSFSPLDYIPQLLIMIVITVIIFSGIDEFIIQNYFSKTRIPDVYDWMMDILGASFGALLRYFIGFQLK